MLPKQSSVWPVARTAAIALFLAVLLRPSLGCPQEKPSGDSLTNGIALRLLGQVREGLESNNEKKLIAAFDLKKMPDGQVFKQQLVSFLAHVESVQVHFNLVRSSAEGEKITAEFDAEIQFDSRGGGYQRHKTARLLATAENGSSGWKLTDLQPRSFFSTGP